MPATAGGPSIWVSNIARTRSPLMMFTVVNTSNNVGTSGSLPSAIEQANQADIPTPSLVNIVDFDIPGTGPFTINVSSAALPQIEFPLTIDGTSQPGYPAGTPLIEIDGGGLTGDGLVVGNRSNR